MNNCTTGIELALQALNLPQGSRVLVPALTFPATAVLRAGLVPVVSDVNTGNWMLTPQIAGSALGTTRISAILPVCAFGCPQPTGPWDEFSARTGLPLVIDAAGAALGNQDVGDKTIVVFSLHATKSLGIGEGGFVVAADSRLIQRIRQLSDFGFDQNSRQVEQAGGNGKMSEYHAAVGLAALESWDDNCRRRRDLAAKYLTALRDAGVSVTLQEKPGAGIYSLFPVALPGSASAGVIASLMAQHGIEKRRWYYPLLHRHPGLHHVETIGSPIVAESLSDRILGLPFHLYLTDEQVEYVCKILAAARE